MLLQTTPSVGADESRATRRRKRCTRRVSRELRLFAPLLALLGECLALATMIAVVERMPVGAVQALRADVYGPTTSISSTSNVSAAPPGIRPGDPLSP